MRVSISNNIRSAHNAWSLYYTLRHYRNRHIVLYNIQFSCNHKKTHNLHCILEKGQNRKQRAQVSSSQVFQIKIWYNCFEWLRCGLSSQQNNRLAQIGRQLARIGDDVNKEYKVQFEQIANELDMSSETVYEKFSKIVISMLTQEANWGRILTLFCFGYYLACRFLRNSSFVQFFTRIIDCVIQFVRNHIAHWIISQGGWLEVASQNLRNERNYLYTFSFIGGMAVVLFAIYFLRKK